MGLGVRRKSDLVSDILIRNGFIKRILKSAFAKLQKATITFVMSVRPSVCPHRTIRLPLDGNRLNLIFETFLKSVEKFQFIFKFDKNNGYFI